jgi:hypothetical protein
VRPGQTRALELDVAAPDALTATITGAVLFDDGTPVSGVEVQAGAALPADEVPSLVFRALTDSAGRYELRVLDLGLGYEVGVVDFLDRYRSFAGVRPGTRGLDIVLRPAWRVLARAHEVRGGSALVLDEDVQLYARAGASAGFWRLAPVAGLPDAGGWHEFWIDASEPDLLALPLGPFATHAGRLVPRVSLDWDEPPRVEFVLEPGLELALHASEESGPFPADHGLYLIQEELQGELDAARRGAWGPQRVLAERAQVSFDGDGRALVRGLSPGWHRFRVFPPDVRVDPETLDVGAGTRALALRWSYRE